MLGAGSGGGGFKISKVGSRFPRNYRYAGKIHPSGVRFNENGYPDFAPHAKAQVKIEGLTGEYFRDAQMANEAIGLKCTPEGYVWHHVEDGATMQLVPKELHWLTQHTDGSAVIKWWNLLWK